MSISLFDMFKIGIGPSSSHTVGPMRAAAQFAQEVLDDPQIGPRVSGVAVHLYGSLAATGHGHGTLDAVLLGLEGNHPETIDPDFGRGRCEELSRTRRLLLGGRREVAFCAADIILHPLTFLPQHSNGMTFIALDGDGNELVTRPMFSIGGGFVVDAEDMDQPVADVASEEDGRKIFSTGAELLAVCQDRGISVSEAMMMRERQWRTDQEIREGALHIWRVMEDCIQRGITTHGTLPGGLGVKRRAATWREALELEDPLRHPVNAFEWVSLSAMAVNEENAAGGRVVTAPTNGAAGIIPAVLHYAVTYLEHADPEEVAVRFLLAAAAVGSLYKEHASISGAEVGCQGEVGSACSMAAAGLAEVMGAKPAQVEEAAEIAMEHNLGLTCDPVAGLVQVPCIERNAMAAVKAITAARFALRGTGEHFVSLDAVIETMRQTGKDMSERYKETATGGLAVTALPVSAPAC